MRRFSSSAFTLIELLVVVAIIALLVAILLPSLQAARMQSKGAVCLSNLHQVSVATSYYVERDRWYPRAWWSAEKRWMDAVKPFVSKKSDVYRCPSDPKQIPVAWDATIILSYGINTFCFADQGSCFWYGVKADRVRRPAGVIVFSDCTPGKYYSGGGSSYIEPIPDVDYRHPGKSFHVAFCDGHAQTLRNSKRFDWDASQ